MTGSRTIKVLVALIVAMTAGAFTLRLLETKPSPLSITDLIALDRTTDYQTDVPMAPRNWHNIVIHSSGPERSDILQRVHFIVDADGSAQMVRPTDLWKKQVRGTHVTSSARNYDYNADSIGICLKGDFAAKAPTEKQMQALVALVRNLQQLCEIPAQNVYLYGPQLNASQYSPGKAFPARSFSGQLLRSF